MHQKLIGLIYNEWKIIMINLKKILKKKNKKENKEFRN